MTEPESETEGETTTEQYDTYTTENTDAITDAITDEERTDIEVQGTPNPGEDRESPGPKRRKKKSRKKYRNEEKWTCDDEALWRIYMRSYIETEERLEKEDKFKRRKPANLPKLPRVKSLENASTPYTCFPLGAFQFEGQTELPDKLDPQNKIRIWKDLRTRPTDIIADEEIEVSKTDSKRWPGRWPCTTRDLVAELRERKRRKRRKRRDVFPCDELSDETTLDEMRDDFTEHKELGHARIPPICPEMKKRLLVDRASGEHPGLVDGDYILFDLPSKTKGNRVYADVCLRGLKGIHLVELSPLRDRQKTWKPCLYQAIVALLAKTQLRYKYAWSANIDYIYDHAWMLFTHIGGINVKEKQRLDDIVVYNYKYSVELELIQETKEVPVVTDVSWSYEEKNLRRKLTLERQELMNVRLILGSEKLTDRQKSSVHKGVKKIEEWFDKLPIRHRNCIFRTTKYSLAFWQDGSFWYLYNPYRCDEFGYWNDEGYACIVKFCSKESLRRHLMILLLRAYVYTVPESRIKISKEPEESKDTETEATEETVENTTEGNVYTVQIFQMVYHCCQIHNLKLLQRGAPKPPRRPVKKKTIDECPFDPLDLRDPCTIEQEEGDVREAIEKPTWLKLFKVTWAKCMTTGPKKGSREQAGKMRWHQYLVEESNKLFSLWGEIHITDGMFDRENRGMQTYACYVVCAGMTRIMAPEYWSSKTLDVIVMCGDRYYTHSKLEAEFKSSKSEYDHVSCWSRYLMSHFSIGETMFEANVLPAICGRLYARSSKYLWQSLEQMFLKYHFGILTCESSCLGVFKFCGAYYMCDVNSLGPPLFQYGEGAAYLMRATYFWKFMTVLVLTIGSPECSQFALNPVEILKVIDVGPTTFLRGRGDRRERDKRKRVPCPYYQEKRRQMRKWKIRRAETIRTIDKTCCKEAD